MLTAYCPSYVRDDDNDNDNNYNNINNNKDTVAGCQVALSPAPPLALSRPSNIDAEGGEWS